MTIKAEVVLDSIAPNGARLTTFELTYPRFIHAELMTHRVFSRNAASSRAIPTAKKIERIRKDPAVPSEWGVNAKGMQASGALSHEHQEVAQGQWSRAMRDACRHAEILAGIRCATCGLIFDRQSDEVPCCCMDPIKLDLHKQVANRIVEPFDHITVVLSGTNFKNHFKLRDHPAADPTYQDLARKWREAYEASIPHLVSPGEWHLPYVQKDRPDGERWIDLEDANDIEKLKLISVGRCARVSYMRQGQGDADENVALAQRLASSGHWSPFEHQAMPIAGIWLGTSSVPKMECQFCEDEISIGARIARVKNHFACHRCAQGHVTSGNFVGWYQNRKDYPDEAGE